MVSLEKERISVATFQSSRLDVILGPASSLVTSHNPPRFETMGATEFYRGYLNRELLGKSYVTAMRINHQ